MDLYYKPETHIQPPLTKWSPEMRNLDGVWCLRDCLGNPLLFNRDGYLVGRIVDYELRLLDGRIKVEL